MKVRLWNHQSVCLSVCASPTNKLKLSHYMPRRRLGGEEYNSYSFSTSALDRGEWSASCPDRVLALGKGPPVPIAQEVVSPTNNLWNYW
jgi:hypothetical protein